MTTLKCIKCNNDKPLDEFAPTHIKRRLCRSCNTEYHRLRRNELTQSPNGKFGITSIHCSVCNTDKSSDEFRWNSSTGYRTECHECEKIIQRCAACKEVKPHEAFPPSKKNATGRHGWCKQCHASQMRTAYETPEGRRLVREAAKDRYKTEKFQKWRQTYLSRPEIKERRTAENCRASQKRYADPLEKIKVCARQKVFTLVKSGKLVRPDACQADGRYGTACLGGGEDVKLEGHHHLGYWPRSVWGMVEWLCEPCHTVADELARSERKELIVLDNNVILGSVRSQLVRAETMFGLPAEELLAVTMACSGEDELHVILNFIEWIESRGLVLTKT